MGLGECGDREVGMGECGERCGWEIDEGSMDGEFGIEVAS